MSDLLLLAVADDNTGYLLRRYAEKHGFRTVRASEPEAVVRLARDDAPAAIVLEIARAGSWAHALLRRLKRDPATSGIPVVLYLWYPDVTAVSADHADATLHPPLLYEDFAHAMEAVGLGIRRDPNRARRRCD